MVTKNLHLAFIILFVLNSFVLSGQQRDIIEMKGNSYDIIKGDGYYKIINKRIGEFKDSITSKFSDYDILFLSGINIIQHSDLELFALVFDDDSVHVFHYSSHYQRETITESFSLMNDNNTNQIKNVFETPNDVFVQKYLTKKESKKCLYESIGLVEYIKKKELTYASLHVNGSNYNDGKDNLPPKIVKETLVKMLLLYDSIEL